LMVMTVADASLQSRLKRYTRLLVPHLCRL
jgi:hypothetical protein